MILLAMPLEVCKSIKCMKTKSVKILKLSSNEDLTDNQLYFCHIHSQLKILVENVAHPQETATLR